MYNLGLSTRPAKKKKMKNEFSACQNARRLIARNRKRSLVEEFTENKLTKTCGWSWRKTNQQILFQLQLLHITPSPGNQ
jgi:hypothetical protein